MTDPSKRSRGRLPRGFTLTELLVTTGLGGLLLLVAAGMLATGSDGFGKVTRRVDANVEARAGLAALTDDLASKQWFNDLAGWKSGDGTWRSDELWFLTLKPRHAQAQDQSAGDLCFVHYYTAVTRELEGESGPWSRKLYRRLVSSSEVIAQVRDGGNPFQDPEADPQRLEDEAVAFNVVQFAVQPMVFAEEALVKWVPGPKQEDEPVLFEITLAVTDERTVARMKKAEDWEDGSEAGQKYFGTPEQEGTKVRVFHVTVGSHE